MEMSYHQSWLIAKQGQHKVILESIPRDKGNRSFSL